MKQPCIRFGKRVFSPGLASTLCTVLLIPALVYLGFWQLDRFQYKTNLEKKLDSNIKLPSIAFNAAIQAFFLQKEKVDDLRYRQLHVEGKFLNDQNILLDNQTFKGQAGYHVITPFQPTTGKELLLVNRGWIPVGKTRAKFPKIQPIQTSSVTGIINQPTRTLQLKQRATPMSLPLRVQSIDFSELSLATQHSFYPFILQLNPQDPLGFDLVPPLHNLSATKHLGYAIQWFMMALAALVYYCVINNRRLEDAK